MFFVCCFRILANRITELEKTMESWCDGQKYIPIFPSQMLLDEFCPENVSVKSQDSRPKYPNEEETGDGKNKLSDSDDDLKEISDSSCEDLRSNCEYDDDEDKKLTSKTVLPLELEELVKEARAEMKASS